MKYIQIWYSWGDQEPPVKVPDNVDPWEYAKKLAVDEAATAQEMTDDELGMRFYEDEGKIVLHYTYDDTFCYYLITDEENFDPEEVK